MKNENLKALFSWGLYPFTFLGASFLFVYLSSKGPQYLELATTLPVLISILLIFWGEKILPFREDWIPKKTDYKTDGFYLLLVQTVLPKVFTFLLAVILLKIAPNFNKITLWPHHWNLLSQVLLVTFISDFLRYWLHRLSHTVPFFWRFHAVHHSVEKLYWLNTSRFHPIEKLFQFILDVLPFVLLGVSKEVLAFHLVLYGVNGFFQHCNIQLKYGWLNYLVSSSDLHRWHHAKEIHESNNNYGNNIILWDLLFGSYYNPNKPISEIGLYNRQYPQQFEGQLTAPFNSELDKSPKFHLRLSDNLINWVMRLKVNRLKKNLHPQFYNDCQNPDEQQWNVLQQFLQKNASTDLGKKYQYQQIKSIEDFQKTVPTHDYEAFRELITHQIHHPESQCFVAEKLILLNKTSGSTNVPKLIPVTQSVLDGLKFSQNLSLSFQYNMEQRGYSGKILGIVSPAQEPFSDLPVPIGSASGHFYKNMPRMVKNKYVVPHSVFEIENFEDKYYIILLLGIQHRDVTYIGTANPSTVLKLNQLLNLRKQDLLNDLKTKTLSTSQSIPLSIQTKVLKKLNPSQGRLEELEILFQKATLSFTDIWPYLRLLNTWTGGSCGVALNAAKALIPAETTIIDPGYLSSEFRGSITVDLKTQGGVPTYFLNFFEFIEEEKFETGQLEFLTLGKLENGKTYYVFVTTPSGLVRYAMNDIVRVVGFIEKMPLIVFVQKGNGITNITGEKLHEGQVLSALNELQLPLAFAQVLANEEKAQYEAYFEFETNPNNLPTLALQLDEAIARNNSEYAEKRKSGRLQPLILLPLKNGTYDQIKKLGVKAGQNESQFKTILLQYSSKYAIPIQQFLA